MTAEWITPAVALIAGLSGLVVAIAQLVVALRSSAKVSHVETLVNGHSEALRNLTATAFERGQASQPGDTSGVMPVRPPLASPPPPPA